MSINSRQKGAGAEREFAGLVHDWAGVRLIRNLEQTRSGGHDLIVHPDEVGSVAESFRQLAIECKRYQTATDAQIQKWWAQAIIQAEQAGLIPVLAYRANRSPWRVVVPISLVTAALTRATQLDYTAALSIKGFCHVVVEGNFHAIKKQPPGAGKKSTESVPPCVAPTIFSLASF
jgi:Holliday junction resolvase